MTVSTEEKMNIKKDVENLVKAINSISPARNRVVQLLKLLPDYATFCDMFPEIANDEKVKKNLESAFGIKFGTRIETISGIGRDISNFYDNISDKLAVQHGDNDIRNGLAGLLETDIENIMNPDKEWALLKIRSLEEVPDYGKDAIKIIKAIYKSRLRSLDILTISKDTGIEERRVHEIIDSLLVKYNFLSRQDVYVAGLKASQPGVCLLTITERYSDIINKM